MIPVRESSPAKLPSAAKTGRSRSLELTGPATHRTRRACTLRAPRLAAIVAFSHLAIVPKRHLRQDARRWLAITHDAALPYDAFAK